MSSNESNCNAKTKSVLIVGAGPSGLAALKEILAVGIEDVVAVDSRTQFGGVFSPDSNVTFENLHLTISNMFMAFSDFPPTDKGCKFWSKDEYFSYLNDYVNHFGLRKYMQLETMADEAVYNEAENQWEVSFSSVSSTTGTTTIRTFDCLIVASGANHTPYIPDNILQNFKGEILHSSEYHSASQVKDRKVLVVGFGESATDAGDSASKVAASVTMWSRRYTQQAPRFVERYENDENYDEHRYLPNCHKPNEVLEHLTISRTVRNLPLGVWSTVLQAFVKYIGHTMGPTSTQGINKQIELNCWSKDFFSSDTALVPGKSASAVTAASKGRLDIVISPEARFGSNQVSFDRPHVFGTKTNHRRMNKNQKVADGKCQLDYEFDTIIACTGFKLDFDWIRIKSNNSSESSKMEVNTNPRTWFKHCFPPNFGESLAFVGFARPHSGGIPQCSEIVSRYIAQLYIGSLELPKDYAQLALSDGDAESACFHLTPHYNMLVDYTAYMMSVAKLLGCTPQIPLMDPVLMVKYWTFPLWPCFFRTKGVGADQTAARVILDKFGPWDALAPIPMLFAQLAMAFIMPFVNFVFFCTHATASSVAVKEEHGGSSEGQKRRALPWLYKWRLSKAHFLYYNSLTLEDFQWVLLQWIASSLIICYLLAKGMTTVFSVVASGILFPFNGHHHKATAAGKKKPL